MCLYIYICTHIYIHIGYIYIYIRYYDIYVPQICRVDVHLMYIYVCMYTLIYTIIFSVSLLSLPIQSAVDKTKSVYNVARPTHTGDCSTQTTYHSTPPQHAARQGTSAQHP